MNSRSAGQTVAASEVAKRSERIRQMGFVGIVARDQQVTRSQSGRGRDRGLVVADLSIGFEPKDLDIEDPDPGAGQPLLYLAQQRCVADQVVLRLRRRRRQQPDADMIEPRFGGAGHHLGRSQLEHGEGGEGNRPVHVRSCVAPSVRPPSAGPCPAASWLGNHESVALTGVSRRQSLLEPPRPLRGRAKHRRFTIRSSERHAFIQVSRLEYATLLDEVGPDACVAFRLQLEAHGQGVSSPRVRLAHPLADRGGRGRAIQWPTTDDAHAEDVILEEMTTVGCG
jgi:hypothetical protein